MEKIYIISDAHLGIESPEKEAFKQKCLLDFFQSIEKDADLLIIAGDLFDFWFDYKWVIPRQYLSVLAALKHLTDNGVQIIYCAGNHDFWLGNFFSENLNITISYDPVELTREGHKFYISHGDGLNKKDVGYRILKSILRNPVTALICKIMHPDLTFSMARWFSTMSRQHRPDMDHRDPYINEAKLLFKKGFDFVIFGHTHDPVILEENGHCYINTGDWINNFTYAVYHQGTLKLSRWNKNTQEGSQE